MKTETLIKIILGGILFIVVVQVIDVIIGLVR